MYKFNSQRIDFFKKMYPFIKDGKKLYVALGGLKVMTLVLSLITPMFYLLLINNIMIGKDLRILPWLIAGYIGIYLFQTLGIVINKITYNKLYLKFNLKIKAQMLSIFTKMDIKTYTKYNTGDLKNRIDSDIGIVEKFFNTHILNYLYSLVSAVVITVILLVMNPMLALIGFVMVPISFWFVKFMGKKVNKLNEEQRELYGKYESFLHSTFQNWKEIKINNLEKRQNEKLQKYRGKLSNLFVKNQIYWYINRAFISFKDFFITQMNLYFIGGLLIISGQMNVGMLLTFMNYYAQFFSNITQITDSVLGFNNDTPNIDRVLEIVNMEIPEKLLVKDLPDSISVNNLCFKYCDEQDLVLKNVHLTVSPKEHISIVGRSGCGKTTLVKLIMGLYEPLTGTVCIGKKDINKIKFESIGKKVGIVLQEPLLLNLTIRENLHFAKKRATDDELIYACKKANILEFIDSLPDKLDTIIGERGIKLSGGQKQRLSIARTILQNPDIIIFDEATSSLDSENEKAIVSAVKELSKCKIVITISHRLSTVLSSNRVVVMDNGRIVAIGKHEDLRRNNEIYKLLFEKQYNAR